MPYIGNKTADTTLVEDNSITSAKIVDSAVITAKVNNDAVTVDKLNLISTSSVPSIEAKGDGSVEGKIQFNCENNSHGQTIQASPHSSGQSWTLKLPDNSPTADKFLKVKSITGSGSTATGQLEFASAGISNYFFAWDSDTGGVSGDIVLDSTQINSGNNYNTSTGLYTAPSAGDYFFQVNFRRGGSGTADLYFEKNGSPISSTVMRYSATSATTATYSVVLTLSANDTIGWHSVNNINPAYCKFFGWRLS